MPKSPKIQHQLQEPIRPTVWFLVLWVLFAGCGEPRTTDLPEYLHHKVGPVFLDPSIPNTWRIEHTFLIKNTTRSRIEIGHVELSCDCAEYQLSQKTLEPGESADLSIVILPLCNLERRIDTAIVNWSKAGDENESKVLQLFVESEIFPMLSASVAKSGIDIDLTKPLKKVIEIDVTAYGQNDQLKSLEFSFPKSSEPVGVGYGVSPRRTDLGSGVVRLTNSISINPAAYLKYDSVQSFEIVAKTDQSSMTIPVRIKRHQKFDIKPRQIVLRSNKREAIIRVVSPVETTAPRVECDSSILSIIQIDQVNVINSKEFEFIVRLEKMPDSAESIEEISFKFVAPDFLPAPYSVFILRE
ncbi:MAG: DUF1573 domain-containing protein [Pirellulaceae bacterium]|nr:DUF1573 domain-containing protein [Pirellulaceae bacterium]